MGDQIPQEWYGEKLRDGAASVEQCTTLKAYFDHILRVDDAARILTKPVHEAATATQDRTEDEVEELCNLWGIIIDLIIEWQIAHPQILRLLYAIARLPRVDRTGKASLSTFTDDAGVLRDCQLWEDLPSFWNLLSDYWYSYIAWRNTAVQSTGTPDAGDNEWTRTNAFAALALVDEGPFKGMKLLSDWGRHALDLAAKGGAATAHIDVPAAVPWLVLAGPELRKIHNQHETEWRQAFEDISKAENLDKRLRDDAADMVARLSET
ncbi:hypothetical protein PG990_000995 [Apiospora arundinis]|uniref:Aldehyde reductase-like protein n=1 Tax=Apiospora arundinis TaxID=335852 RepID=A0ABR2I1Y4_9PEZI